MLRGRESNRGLGDYANCYLQLLEVSDYIIPAIGGVWRIVSTDLLPLYAEGCLGIAPTLCWDSTDTAKFSNPELLRDEPILEPPVQPYTTPYC